MKFDEDDFSFKDQIDFMKLNYQMESRRENTIPKEYPRIKTNEKDVNYEKGYY